MSELNFSQPERRSLAKPVLIAFAVLAVVFTAIYFLTPHSAPRLTVTRTVLYPAHIVFSASKAQSSLANGTRVVGQQDTAEDDLYVLTTVKIDNRLPVPMFIKDITATLNNADGTTFSTSAVEKQDLDAVYTSFPAVKALASPPLLRESSVPAGQTAEGMVMLQLPIPQSTWDRRQSATLTLDFYHQPSITLPIPK